MKSEDDFMEAIGLSLGYLAAVITFFSAWAYCAFTYGFLFGFGLGWLPASILAGVVFSTVRYLWPLALIGAAFIAIEFTPKETLRSISSIVGIIFIASIPALLVSRTKTWKRIINSANISSIFNINTFRNIFFHFLFYVFPLSVLVNSLHEPKVGAVIIIFLFILCASMHLAWLAWCAYTRRRS